MLESLFENLGKYAGFIAASYGFAVVILGVMTVATLRKARLARLKLAGLEAEGIRLRDDNGRDKI